MSGVNVEITQNVTKKIRKFITPSGQVVDGGAENLGEVESNLGAGGGNTNPPGFNK